MYIYIYLCIYIVILCIEETAEEGRDMEGERLLT
jgi:hypothetical protein